MNIDEIRTFCMRFPEATETIQWGDDLCFKVRGKIFAIVGLAGAPARMCFKCDPETFAELIERDSIHPAPYVGRYKWVILDRIDALGSTELRDLIGRSYDMVSAKAPKRTGKKPTRATTSKQRPAVRAKGRHRPK